MSADLEMFSNRLLSALLNGSYQGLLLTAVVWLALKMAPRANAATRHLVWFVNLLLIALLPAIHFVLPERERIVEALETDLLGDPEISDLAGFLEAFPPFSPSENPSRWMEDGFVQADGTALADSDAPERPADSLLSNPAHILNSDAVDPRGHPSAPENGVATGVLTEPGNEFSLVGQVSRFFSIIPPDWQLPVPSQAALVLMAAWVVLASLRLGNLARQCWRLQALKRRGSSVPGELRTRFDELSAEMGIRRKPRLLTCGESGAPMAVGFGRPTVLLPAKMFGGADALQLEPILRHELAHVSRGDDWTNLLQQIIGALLFFHPAVWWLSRRLTVE